MPFDKHFVRRTAVVGPQSQERVTGLSVAIGTLIAELKSRGIDHVVIATDIAGSPKRSGSLALRSALSAMLCVLRFIKQLPTTSIVYLPLATSPFGFVRDAAIIWPAWCAKRRIVGHLHGGG